MDDLDDDDELNSEAAADAMIRHVLERVEDYVDQD